MDRPRQLGFKPTPPNLHTVPDGLAIFSGGGQSLVTNNGTTSIFQIQFSASYLLQNFATFNILGTGIIGTGTIDNVGTLQFNASSTAGTSNITNHGTLNFIDTTGRDRASLPTPTPVSCNSSPPAARVPPLSPTITGFHFSITVAPATPSSPIPPLTALSTSST